MNEEYFSEFLDCLENSRTNEGLKNILNSFCSIVIKEEESYPRNVFLTRVYPFLDGKEKILKSISQNPLADEIIYYFLLSFSFYSFPPEKSVAFDFNHRALTRIILEIDRKYKRYASNAVWNQYLRQKAKARQLNARIKKANEKKD